MLHRAALACWLRLSALCLLSARMQNTGSPTGCDILPTLKRSNLRCIDRNNLQPATASPNAKLRKVAVPAPFRSLAATYSDIICHVLDGRR